MPIYETAEDRAAQREIAERLRRATGHTYVELPPLAKMDYEFKREDARPLYVEVKRRKNKMRAYPTYMIDLSKVEFIRNNGHAGVVIVEWLDAIGMFDLGNDKFEVGIGGRGDRNDKFDTDRVAYFKIGLARKLWDKPQKAA